MRLISFLACALAISLASVFDVDLQAGCRCNRAARKQARQERRACRRSVAAPTCRVDSTSGYPDVVQPLGSVSADQPVGVGRRGVDANGNQYVVTNCWTTADGRRMESRCTGRFCYITRADQPASQPAAAAAGKPVEPAPVTPAEPETVPTIELFVPPDEPAPSTAPEVSATEQTHELQTSDPPDLVAAHPLSDPPEAP